MMFSVNNTDILAQNKLQVLSIRDDPRPSEQYLGCSATELRETPGRLGLLILVIKCKILPDPTNCAGVGNFRVSNKLLISSIKRLDLNIFIFVFLPLNLTFSTSIQMAYIGRRFS